MRGLSLAEIVSFAQVFLCNCQARNIMYVNIDETNSSEDGRIYTSRERNADLRFESRDKTVRQPLLNVVESLTRKRNNDTPALAYKLYTDAAFFDDCNSNYK